MKKICFFVAAIMGAIFFSGCEPKASEEELKQMCETLTKVRGEVTVPSVGELTQEINQSYEQKEKKLLAWKARDMNGWDEELAAKLKDLETDTEEKGDDEETMTPEKLKEMYAKKKEIGAKQFDDDLLKLTVEKKNKLTGVEDVVKAAQAEFDSKTMECVKAAGTEQISKTLAQCRIAAPDKDTYWNKCK